MAITKPIDNVEYMLSGTGDPNAANMQTDPVLKNLYTPPPNPLEAAPAVEVPRIDPAQEVSPRTFKRPEEPIPPATNVGTSTGSMSSLKYAGAPSQNWGGVDKYLDTSLKKSLSAEAQMQAAIEKNKALPKAPTPEIPNYEDNLVAAKTELPEYTKAANETVQQIKKQVDEYGGVNKILTEEIKAADDEYKNKVDPFDRDMENLIRNPPEFKEIDQSRVWKNTNTLQKIMMVVGLALASKSDAGLKGAIDTLNRLVTNDIDAQKQDNIFIKDRYQSKLTGEQNLVAYYQNKYKNKVDGLNAAKVHALSTVTNSVALLSQGLTNKQSILNANKLIGELSTAASKNAFDAGMERKKVAEAEAKATIDAAKEGAAATQEVAKIAATAATIKEKQIADKADSELKKAELMQKNKAEMPSVFTADKYASFVDKAIPPSGANKERNKETHEQLGVLKEQFAVKKAIRDYFNRAKKIGMIGSMQRWGSDQEVLEDANIYLFPTMKTIMGERFSDADAKALVDPFLPSRSTPVDRIEERNRAMETMLGTKIGKTYYVDALGLRKIMQADFDKTYNSMKPEEIKRVK